MNQRPILLTLWAFIGIAGMVSCSEKDDLAKVPFSVRLTDSPGDYEEVNVEILGVQVHSGDAGWITLQNANPGIYNLLDYTNGNDTEIASDLFPVGKISQIRLILGEYNTVKVNGQIHDLKTPSAHQSGLKLQVNTSLKENIGYSMLLDFDAAQSVVKTGNGDGYILKPVIRVITEVVDGAISGNIIPSAVKPAILAITGADTVGTYSDDQGNYLIKGLKAGKYKVVIVPNSEYQVTEIENVDVNIGTVTEIGEVKINSIEN
jgi:hypothetical protein